MYLRSQTIQEKKLVGNRVRMSFSHPKTHEVWRKFMPNRKEIVNPLGSDLYSIDVYPPAFFINFTPDSEFEKWAAIEVENFDSVPEGMETIIFPEGLYAVFLHKGTVDDGPITYAYIFGDWLPNSGFRIDERPLFAVMGEKYKNNDPNSEEEIWIPIKPEKTYIPPLQPWQLQ